MAIMFDENGKPLTAYAIAPAIEVAVPSRAELQADIALIWGLVLQPGGSSDLAEAIGARLRIEAALGLVKP